MVLRGLWICRSGARRVAKIRQPGDLRLGRRLTAATLKGYESPVQSPWQRHLRESPSAETEPSAQGVGEERAEQTGAPRGTAVRSRQTGLVVEAALVGLIFLTGLWFFFKQLIVTKFDAVPGDLGDSRFNALVLEHGYRFLRHDAWHQAFWSPKWSFFPHKNILAYSDNLLGTLPLYALARWVGLGEMAAFNAWIVLLSVANFAAMFLLLRGLQLSRLGAALGGFVFAFAMPRGAQLNHVQLFAQFFTPLCFYCLVQLRQVRPWAVWGAVGCLVMQLYAAVYLGWFLALALGISVIVAAVLAARSRDFRATLGVCFRRLWLHAVAATLLGAAALLPMAIHYARAQAEVGPRQYGEISMMLPRISSYVVPANYTAVYHWLLGISKRLPYAQEHTLFAGFAVILCSIVMLVSLMRAPRTITKNGWNYVWIAIWLSTIVATLFVNGSLWQLLRHAIPGAGAIRAVSRIVLLQLLALGVAAAWAVSWLEKRAGVFAAGLLAVLVIVENSGAANYHFSAREHAARIARVKSELTGKPCAAFLLTGTGEAYRTHLDAMWASLETKTPTVNGYSGNYPLRWPFEHAQEVKPWQEKLWFRRHHTRSDGVCTIKS